MMDAGTLELVELDTRLDFEHTPECEQLSGCEQHATWIAMIACCKEQAYACDRHYSEMNSWLRSNRWCGFTCTICHTQNPEIIWTPIP